MFSEMNSLLDFFENMNKKKVLIALFGIIVIILLTWVSNNVGIQVIDSHYRQYNGHYYRIFSGDAVTWDNARVNCRRLGGHLVTITTSREQELIEGLLGDQCYWIGAMKDTEASGWKWVTNEEFSYTNWADGEPSNSGFKENVIMLYSSGSWNDISSENVYVSYSSGYTKNLYYICEWEHKINFVIGENENYHSLGLF